MVKAMAYLLDNEVEILSAALHLVSNTVELDLGALLEPWLDRDFKDLVHLGLLAGSIVRLALDLHLLDHAFVYFLQRERQGPFNCSGLGSHLPAAGRARKAIRVHARGTATRERGPAPSLRPKLGKHILKAGARTESAGEICEGFFGVAKRESLSGAGGKVE
jgi:hypothetical protein